MITTEGFRDSLEIADEGRFDQYDVFIERPKVRAIPLSALQRIGDRARAHHRGRDHLRGGYGETEDRGGRDDAGRAANCE